MIIQTLQCLKTIIEVQQLSTANKMLYKKAKIECFVTQILLNAKIKILENFIHEKGYTALVN